MRSDPPPDAVGRLRPALTLVHRPPPGSPIAVEKAIHLGILLRDRLGFVINKSAGSPRVNSMDNSQAKIFEPDVPLLVNLVLRSDGDMTARRAPVIGEERLHEASHDARVGVAVVRRLSINRVTVEELVDQLVAVGDGCVSLGGWCGLVMRFQVGVRIVKS